MKNKKIFLLILCLFLLVGCSNKESSSESNNLNNDVDVNNSEVGSSLKDPIVEWCQLYNPNGFDTITCVISNPNTVDIDITYDLVFYKDGNEVSRQEEWSNFQISPKHKDVIWGNVDIPKSIDVDEVKMENITVTKAYYESIDADIKYVETIEDKAYFSVKHTKKPTIDYIYVFYYNDINNNKKCDKGELNVVGSFSTTDIESKFDVDTNVVGSKYGIDYNEYEIYYNAY